MSCRNWWCGIVWCGVIHVPPCFLIWIARHSPARADDESANNLLNGLQRVSISQSSADLGLESTSGVVQDYIDAELEAKARGQGAQGAQGEVGGSEDGD